MLYMSSILGHLKAKATRKYHKNKLSVYGYVCASGVRQLMETKLLTFAHRTYKLIETFCGNFLCIICRKKVKVYSLTVCLVMIHAHNGTRNKSYAVILRVVVNVRLCLDLSTLRHPAH